MTELHEPAAAGKPGLKLPPLKGARAPGGFPDNDQRPRVTVEERRERAAQSALTRELGNVRGAAPGGANHILFKSAAKLGEIVGFGALNRTAVEAALLGAALERGHEATRATSTIKSGLDTGAKKPRDPIESGNGPAPKGRRIDPVRAGYLTVDTRTEAHNAKEHDRARRDAAEMWLRGVPVEGTPAEIYWLKHRGFKTLPPARDVRFVENITIGRQSGSAIVFRVVDPLTGEGRAIQAVFLHPDGSPVMEPAGKDGKSRKCKRSRAPYAGRAVVFGDIGAAGTVTVVECEGPETAWAVHEATGHVTIATLSVGTLGKPALPENVKDIIIHGEPRAKKLVEDAAAQKLIDDAAQRRFAEGRNVWIAVTGDPANKDAADLLKARRSEAVQAMIENATRWEPSPEPVDDTATDHDPIPMVRDLLPAEEYPVDALGSLGEVPIAINAITQAPLALCCQSVLAAIHLAAQGHIDVVLPIGDGRRVPVSEYFATIAESGERKTTADNMAMQAVSDHEAALRVEGEKLSLDHANALDTWEAERTRIKNDKKMAPDARKPALDRLGPKPEGPPPAMMTTPDPTLEGLHKLLVIGLPSVGIFAAEGGSFVGGHAMAEDAKKRSAAGLNSHWDGTAVKRVRGGDGAQIIAGKRVSMHIMIQQVLVGELYGDHILEGQGFIARLLPVSPKSTMGSRTFKGDQPGAMRVLEVYRRELGRRLAEPMPMRDGTRNELEPRPVKMTLEAITLWRSFTDLVELQLGPDGDLRPISGFANKAGEHAARIAAALAWWDDPKVKAINAEVLTRAILLTEHYMSEVIRLTGAGSVQVRLSHAEKVRLWLADQWDENHINVRALVTYGPGSIRDADTARSAIETLVEHGWLVPAPAGTIVAGHAARECWRIVGKGV